MFVDAYYTIRLRSFGTGVDGFRFDFFLFPFPLRGGMQDGAPFVWASMAFMPWIIAPRVSISGELG